ncbi:MAG: response regulator, partial [Chitinophagaceae bacterium]
TYDLILMDVHMPDMDGLTATKHIRNFNNKQKAAIPIIALTASAFKSDTNRYLKAGMNSYVTKPYTQQKLLLSIAEQMNISLQNNQQQPPIPVTVATDNKIAPLKLYSLERIYELDDSTEFVQQMVDVFIEQVTEETEAINKAVNNSDWPALYKSVHKLKPTIATFHIERGNHLVEKIESQIRSSLHVNELPGAATELKWLLQEVIKQMKADFNNQ